LCKFLNIYIFSIFIIRYH